MRETVQAQASCPGENTLAMALARDLSAADIDRVGGHIDQCDSCRELMAVLAAGSRAGAPARDTPEPLPASARDRAVADTLAPGTRVGRYAVTRVLGAGGMGVVYEAHDPELDRRVALKLIRPELGADSPTARRLARESRALARLSHPNVVTVFDIGDAGGRLFIAMELVDGVTLNGWLRARPRSVGEVLRVFRAAGRGLKAVHDAGLVHRDFKPDNVLIDRAGRVRVSDFGLARSIADSDSHADSDAGASADDPAAADAGLATTLPAAASITRTGIAVGTPAYMAPEQHRGERTDARTDVFAFSVALYEAIAGQRPFGGRALEEISAEIQAGRVRPFPRRPRVPRWLRRAILDGLAADPASRPASMRQLLSRLVRPRWHIGVAAAAVALALGGGAAAYVVAGPGAAQESCSGAAEQLVGVWDPARKAEIRRAFARSGVADAAQRWDTIAAVLDRYAASWVAMRRDVCQATRRGEQSAELLDVRMHCLQRNLFALGQSTGLLAASDQTVVINALGIVEGLPRNDLCSAAVAVEARIPAPADPATRTAVDQIRRDLLRGDLLRLGGRFDEAIAVLEPAAQRAVDIGYRPIEAEALYRLGVVQVDAAAPTAAASTMRKAAHAAEAGRHDEFAVLAWSHLISIAATDLRDRERALEYADQARAALERLGPNPLAEGIFYDHLGHLHNERGELDEALAAYQRSARLLEHEDPGEALIIRDAIGTVLGAQGKFEEALALHREVLAAHLERLPGDHPYVAAVHINLASDLSSLGDIDGALDHMFAAHRITMRMHPAVHQGIGESWHNLGELLRSAGRFEEALLCHALAHAIFGHLDGDRRERVAMSLEHEGGALMGLGRHVEAVDRLRRACDLFRDALGDATMDLARCRTNLADAMRLTGQVDEGIGHARAALSWFERELGQDNVFTGYPLHYLGRLHVAGGRPAQAIEPLERALAIWDRAETDPAEVASARSWLARAVHGSGRDPARAARLAADARRVLVDAGQARDADRAELDAWLVAHPDVIATVAR